MNSIERTNLIVAGMDIDFDNGLSSAWKKNIGIIRPKNQN